MFVTVGKELAPVQNVLPPLIGGISGAMAASAAL
jgi:hypothetical protein